MRSHMLGLLLALLIPLLLINYAHAIGIGPGRVVLNFTPSIEMASRVGVLNNEDRAYEAQLYVTGDLAQYVTFNATTTMLEPHTGKYFNYSIKLPSWLAGPKMYDTRIGAVEVASGTSMLGAVAGVEMQLWINVPDTGPRPAVVEGELPPIRQGVEQPSQPEQPGQEQPEQPPVSQETALPLSAQQLGGMLLIFGGGMLGIAVLGAYIKIKPGHGNRRKR